MSLSPFRATSPIGSPIEARDGEAALEVLGKNTLPNVVVIDLLMPARSGMELIRRLRSEPLTAWIPIVAVGGNAYSDEQTLARTMMDRMAVLDGLLATVKSVGKPGALPGRTELLR